MVGVGSGLYGTDSGKQKDAADFQALGFRRGQRKRCFEHVTVLTQDQNPLSALYLRCCNLSLQLDELVIVGNVKESGFLNNHVPGVDQ